MHFITPSELLLNKDGSIYHLNLLPGDISKTILLVGDPSRVNLIASFFDSIEILKENREFKTCTGIFREKRFTVISTGIGTDNIDIVINELDALANIDFDTYRVRQEKKVLRLIRIGTCGILQDDISPGEGIVSSWSLGFDNLLMFYEQQGFNHEIQLQLQNYFKNKGLDIPFYIYPANNTLFKLFSIHFPFGITATCPGFYAPQGRHLRLNPAYPTLIDSLADFRFNNYRFTNFEMETSAIYGLSHLLGHECITVDLGIANRLTQEVLTPYNVEMQELVIKVLDLLIETN